MAYKELSKAHFKQHFPSIFFFCSKAFRNRLISQFLDGNSCLFGIDKKKEEQFKMRLLLQSVSIRAKEDKQKQREDKKEQGKF